MPPTAPALSRSTRGGDGGLGGRRTGGWLALIAVILLAINLRTAVTSLGALLDEVRDGLRLSGTLAGVATMLPALSFAVFGSVTPALHRRFGSANVLAGAMGILAVGQALRALTDSAAVFLITSAAALAGIAVGNVLLPVLVRHHFPNRVGLLTGVYSMTLTLGAGVAAATAVPIADAFGTWRAGLGVWAVLALVAVVPWLLPALRRAGARAEPVPVDHAGLATPVPQGDSTGPDGRGTPVTVATRRVATVRAGRTRVGRALALYFGAQSLNAYAMMGWMSQVYRDAGFPASTAGLLLAGVMAAGVPVGLLMPTMAVRRADLRSLVAGLGVITIVAYVGLMVAPRGGAVLWMALLAVGQGAFPLALAMIGTKARTPEGTVALSGFVQSVGYSIAALGPLGVGVLYDLTRGWTLPLGLLVAVAVAQTFAGLVAARAPRVEDGRP